MNLAIDAGGTHLRAEIWTEDKLSTSLHAKSDEIGLYAWIVSILEEYKDVKTIGIAYAGQVEEGKIISSPNIHIEQYEIKKLIESEFDVSLKIENDLTCAVLAESHLHKSDNICALYVGTGLGLGVIESGKIVRGAHNMAAEIGHIPYKQSPLTCGCGRSNCIELFASGSAIKKWISYYKLDCESTLKGLSECDDKNILKEFESALIYAAGTTLSLFNPEVLVLGGGIVVSNPYLKDIILTQVDSYALPQALDGLNICLSTIENAPIKGALLLKDHDD